MTIRKIMIEPDKARIAVQVIGVVARGGQSADTGLSVICSRDRRAAIRHRTEEANQVSFEGIIGDRVEQLGGGQVERRRCSLALAIALVRARHEGLVLKDWDTETSAEVILLERRLEPERIEPLAGIELRVAHILEERSVDLVRTALGDDVDYRAGRAAKLRIAVRADHRKLRDLIERHRADVAVLAPPAEPLGTTGSLLSAPSIR